MEMIMFQSRSISKVTFFILIPLFCSCRQNIEMKRVTSGNFNSFGAAESLVPIIILSAVEAAPCEGGSISANVYKVKVFENSETAYVFEVCNEMVWHESNLLGKEAFVVRISKDRPLGVLIPATVNIPENATIMFGEILRMEY